jgi:hypothetical protein
MINQETQINQSESEGYRGVLVYREGYGYKILSLIIDLYAPDERSYVVSRLGEIGLVEEAEHLPACIPLAAIEVYNFLVTDGTEITLTVKSRQAGVRQARYTIHSDRVEVHSSLLKVYVIKAKGDMRASHFHSMENKQ